MAKLKVGVIGVGALGRHHARLYKASENCEMVGVFDVNHVGAQAVAAEFDLACFEDMNDLIDRCDALSIAVPATKHYDVAIKLLSRGKHLLIEKPLAVTVEDASAIVAEAEKNNLVVGVGHVERFNPAMNYLEQHNGNTRYIEAERLAPYPPERPGQHRRGVEVGVVLDLMIHDLDLVLSMVDSEVESFDAVGIPVLSETEDIASVRIKFKNGAVANVKSSRVSDTPNRCIRVFQTDAYISLDYADCKGTVVKKGQLALAKKEVVLDKYNALAEELEDFISAVNETVKSGEVVPTKVPGIQGLAAIKLALAIQDEIVAYNDKYGVEFA